MKRHISLSRRFAVGASITAAAILLPTAALAASSGPAAPARAAAPDCTSSQTRVWYGLPSDGTLMASYYQLEFSNISHSTCSFYGYPGVSAINVHGNQVGKPATHSGGRLSVVLSPDQTAHVVLRIAVAGAICEHPQNATVLKVYAPNQRAATYLGLASQGCPGVSVLHVDSIHPGAGIPVYTTR
jgi:Protein of unknown function (DUF4232)